MHQKKMYNQLVFYLEACESGSMFQNVLPENISIYASSASNPTESSWGCYCGSEAKVNGKDIGSCLGDLYSCVWMEDSDLEASKVSIAQQFAVIHKKVDKSDPMEWGDKTFEKELVTDFQGTTDSTSVDGKLMSKVKKLLGVFFGESKNEDLEYQHYLDLAKKSAIESRSIKLDYLYRKAFKSGLLTDDQELATELHLMEVNDTIFREIALRLKLNLTGEKNENIQFQCLRNSVNHYKATCQNFTEYTLKYVQYLSVACKTYTEDMVKQTITDVCEGN
jgi:legumain